MNVSLPAQNRIKFLGLGSAVCSRREMSMNCGCPIKLTRSMLDDRGCRYPIAATATAAAIASMQIACTKKKANRTEAAISDGAKARWTVV